MPNINMTYGGVGSRIVSGPAGTKKLTKTIDIKDVVTEKGSALAANDLIQVFDVPLQTWVMLGQIYVKVACAPCTVLTLNLGHDGDDNQWVDALDGTTAGYGTMLDAPDYFTAANTIDIDIASLTGALSTGILVATITLQEFADESGYPGNL